MPLEGMETSQHNDTILNAIENNDIVLITGTSSLSVTTLLQRVKDTSLIYVSDVRCLLQVHNDTSDLIELGVRNNKISLTYAAAIHGLYAYPKNFLNADFIVLDHIDDRSASSDFFLALMQTQVHRAKNKLIIPLTSGFQVDIYKSYLQTFERGVHVLDLISQPEIEMYYAQDTTDPHKKIASTVRKILETNTSNAPYHVIIVTPSSELDFHKAYLKEHLTGLSYSTLTDTSEYNINTHRCLIFTDNTQKFFTKKHNIKCIIDCGYICTTTTATNDLPVLVQRTTNQNKVNQNRAILYHSNSKYFCLVPKESLQSFEHGIRNTNLVHYALYARKFDIRLEDMSYLIAPTAAQITSAYDIILYMGLIEVRDGQIKFTAMADVLVKFEIPPKLAVLGLYVAMVRSWSLGKEMTIFQRLIGITSVVEPHLIKWVDPRLKVPDSDLLTWCNLANFVVFGEKGLGKVKQTLSRDSIQRVKMVVKNLANIISYSGESIENDDDIEECLVFGGQFMLGTIRYITTTTGDAKLTVEPLRPFDEDVEMLLPKHHINSSSFQNGDLVLFGDYTLEDVGKGRQRAILNSVSKVKKDLAFKATKIIRQA